MDLECLDHVHFSVPDLQQAKQIFGPFLNGRFVDDYGGPAVNAWGAWHTSGGDFIQAIEPGKPVFGGAPIAGYGILSVSFRVAEIDAGIAHGTARGLTLRSRIGSEDIGLGKNVVQAQFQPEPISGLALEFIEHQLPGEYVSLTDAAVEYVEHALAPGVGLDAATRALEPILGPGFEAQSHDDARGLRVRLHRRLGLRLVEARHGAGLRAIAFRCDALAAGVAMAEAAGLVARGGLPAGAREIDFAPWSNVEVRLVAN